MSHVVTLQKLSARIVHSEELRESDTVLTT